MLYIRTDANPTIATGHVMRCMSIAREVMKLGQKITFLVADEHVRELIESNGYSCICMNSKWDDLDLELERLILLIQEYNIDRLLIDSYYVTEHYLSELRKHTKVFYLDDLAMFPYPVDVLIKYNNYVEKLDYHSGYNWNVNYFLGCKYIPLREEFRGIKRIFRNIVSRILITTGGADYYHVAKKFIHYLEQETLLQEKTTMKTKQKELLDKRPYDIRTIQYHIIVGNFNSDREYLEELASKYPQIILHFNVTNMSEIMRNCDIAITAGGSTMYELCACGVPMITYTFADNQLLGAKGFEQLGVASYCGDIRNGELDLWRRINAAIRQYATNQEYRFNIGSKMQSLVDGKGAIRLARILTNPIV